MPSYHTRLIIWLRNRLGDGNFAEHKVETLTGDSTAFYFRRVEDMLAFLDTFPDLQLADEVALRGDSAPAVL